MSPFILASLVACVLSNALLFVWYSPVAFGKTWLRIHKTAPYSFEVLRQKKGVAIVQLVTTYVFSVAILFTLALLLPTNLVSVFICVIALYVGFIVPVLVQQAVTQKMSLQAFGITAGFHLVNVILIGCVFLFVR